MSDQQNQPWRSPTTLRFTGSQPAQVSSIPLSRDELRSFEPPAHVENALVLFTDCSFSEYHDGLGGKKTRAGAGLAWWDQQERTWHGKGFIVPRVGGSNEAEMYAVCEALALAETMSHAGSFGANFIHTDSQAVIIEMRNIRSGHQSSMPLVKDLAKYFIDIERRLLARGISVDISWVKGHKISIGNEIADRLAVRSAGQVEEGSLAAEEVSISPQVVKAIAKQAVAQVATRRDAVQASQWVWETPEMKNIRENLPPHLRAQLEETWIKPCKAFN